MPRPMLSGMFRCRDPNDAAAQSAHRQNHSTASLRLNCPASACFVQCRNRIGRPYRDFSVADLPPMTPPFVKNTICKMYAQKRLGGRAMTTLDLLSDDLIESE